MVRRIGLLGGECTGKTALAEALALDLPACTVTEALRDFVDEHGRPPLPEEQALVFAQQVAREDAAALSCSRPALVTDPAPLMTAVYSLLYFDDPSLVAAGVDHARGYDLLVWCDDAITWTPDGEQRDGPERRAAADAIIADLVRAELVPRGMRVVRAEGDVPARVATVRRAWLPGAPEAAT